MDLPLMAAAHFCGGKSSSAFSCASLCNFPMIDSSCRMTFRGYSDTPAFYRCLPFLMWAETAGTIQLIARFVWFTEVAYQVLTLV
jgi:hypothetical protein